MIYEDLRTHDRRREIEGMVITNVEERLENCKKQVREDIGMDDVLKKMDEGLSDPRD